MLYDQCVCRLWCVCVCVCVQEGLTNPKVSWSKLVVTHHLSMEQVHALINTLHDAVLYIASMLQPVRSAYKCTDR